MIEDRADDLVAFANARVIRSTPPAPFSEISVGPALDTEDRGGRVSSRARFRAELRAGQREAATRASRREP
jgi:hypothetical protein